MRTKIQNKKRTYPAKVKLSMRLHPLVVRALLEDTQHSSMAAKVNDILMRHYKLSI